MEKVFDKHEILFCVISIIIYLLLNSFCIQNFGTLSGKTTIINSLLSISLIVLIIKSKRTSYYGLVRVKELRKFLYFIPLVLIVSTNLWNGININNTLTEIIFFIITMLNIGFIEEIIFRGFLFKLLAKDSICMAILVSSITFGIGHIINLFTGAELISTLMQICYAMSAGYLFAVIFHKSNSLLPCIVTHSLLNSLSIFNVDNFLTVYITPIFLIVLPLIYAIYINKNIKQ